MHKHESQQTYSNNMLYHARSIPIDISYLFISPNYIKANANLTKID